MKIRSSLYYDIESDNIVALKTQAGINGNTIDRYPVNPGLQKKRVIETRMF